MSNASKAISDAAYSMALKEATQLYRSKKGSYDKLVALVNEKYQLLGEGGRKLTKSTLRVYVKDKKIGVSPDKRGPKRALPPDFFDILSAHIDVTQLTGNEETKPRHLKALIGAALCNTEFSDLNTEVVYRKFRQRYPDLVSPTRAMEMEERRALWTTYPNIIRWFDGSKECLLHYGYAQDRPQRVVDIFIGHPIPMAIDGKFNYD